MILYIFYFFNIWLKKLLFTRYEMQVNMLVLLEITFIILTFFTIKFNLKFYVTMQRGHIV